MPSALLARLQVKKPPKSRKVVQVAVPAPKEREAVVVDTRMSDKREMKLINRDEFIKTIKGPIVDSNIEDLDKSTVPANTVSKDTVSKDTVSKDTGSKNTIPNVEVSNLLPKKRKGRVKLVAQASQDQASRDQALQDQASRDQALQDQASRDQASQDQASQGKANTTNIDETTGENVPIMKIRRKRRTKPPIGVVKTGPTTMLQIADVSMAERIGTQSDPVSIRASSYYMNNREIFTNFMSSLFGPYKEELRNEALTASCDNDEDTPFTPMTHQKIVRDYMNAYTPYRGLLLYHGLGSGKTCSSIVIAEGLKSSKPVIVMTPASLRRNYIEELKKCGDSLYRKNQFWEFINTSTNPEYIDTLSRALSLSVEYIRKSGGAWLVNVKKYPNFETLSSSEKASLDAQLDEMIRHKYQFINYNGLRASHIRALTKEYTVNPFDGAVVIIDEAHNFVSRIVNKLGKKDTISGRLYEYLMDARDARIVMLTGTPIINYPNEVGILFNILRGKIQTWYFKLTVNSQRKVNEQSLRSMFKSTVLGGNIMDFIEYRPTSTTLIVTRNPFGFVNKTKGGMYDGIRTGERGEISDEQFVEAITKTLMKNKIQINPNDVRVETFKALPDTLDDFKAFFIDDNNEVKNMNLFQRRIMGLTSYFRSAQESLMPKFSKASNFHIVKVPMSQFQFSVYEEARVSERKLEIQNARKRKKSKSGVFEDTVSTYRIFSRAFCNFVFPRPHIVRPMPSKNENLETAILNQTADEDILDAATVQEKLANVDGRYEADELANETDSDDYDSRIRSAIASLNDQKQEYLSPEGLEIYSPKFLNILENITDEKHRGLHLIYSQFRTLEGIGIMKLVLEANGFARFKIREEGKDNWVLDIQEEDIGKPMFALYTGTESAEEKEIIRNVFNGTWKFIPTGLATQLSAISSNNLYGEIIKVLMITASGAEGISLRNVRYVHITEPYWHPVRLEQVIGRARRICSHQDLDEIERTVDVFLYLMTFSPEQLASDESIELRLKDKSKLDATTPLTSDEALYEIATLKEGITSQLLLAIKEASFDCSLHSRVSGSEQLKCLSFGNANSSTYSFAPSITDEEVDSVADQNKQNIKWRAVELELDGIKYALNKDTGEVYDLEEYRRGVAVKVGTLQIEGKQYRYVPI